MADDTSKKPARGDGGPDGPRGRGKKDTGKKDTGAKDAAAGGGAAARRDRAEQMRKERDRADKRRRNSLTVGIVVVVVVLIAVAAFGINKATTDSAASGDVPANATDLPGGGVLYEPGAATADAEPVAVKIYEDFQCPVCQQFQQTFGADLDQAAQAGDISIQYVPITILNAQSTTRYSSRSANAAMCVLDAEGPDAFHEFDETLYANQPPEGGDGLPDSQLSNYASDAGASVRTCIEDEQFKSYVDDLNSDALSDGVSGTPTVYVDGKQLDDFSTVMTDIAAAAA